MSYVSDDEMDLRLVCDYCDASLFDTNHLIVSKQNSFAGVTQRFCNWSCLKKFAAAKAKARRH